MGGGGSFPPTCTSSNGPRRKKRCIYSLCVLKEKMNVWQDEQMKCRNLYAVGVGGEGAKNCSVHIWNFYCFEPPIFRGTEPGFFFLNFLPQKVCSLFFTPGSLPVLFFPNGRQFLHCKYDQFHFTLETVLISSSFCVFVDQQEVVKKSSNNSRCRT